MKHFLKSYYYRARYGKIRRILYERWLIFARPLICIYNRFYLQKVIQPDLFQNVKTFCMFIGHRRSGHSIIGSLLDAHPDIVLSDELHVLRRIKTGFSMEEIFQLILKKSMSQAKKGRKKEGRRGSHYSYAVPGQWQGKYRKIRVIGDKDGGGTTDYLASSPELIERTFKTIPIDIKFIIVIRNPYDNISTEYLRQYHNKSMTYRIDYYFTRCRVIQNIMQHINHRNILFVRHENFIKNPQDNLNKICEFMGVENTVDYLDACTGIVYHSPVKSRHEIQWRPVDIDSVQKKISQFEFLTGYTYEN